MQFQINNRNMVRAVSERKSYAQKNSTPIAILLALLLAIFLFSSLIINYWVSKSGPKRTNNNDHLVSERVFKFPDSTSKFEFSLPDGQKLQENSDSISLQNNATMQQSDFIDIVHRRIYRLSVSLRIPQNTDKKDVRLFIGFATYDQNKKLETSQPGTHRYFLNVGIIQDKVAKGKDGWLRLEGYITGVGATFKKFRATTRYAKLIVLTKFQSTDTLVEIRSLVLREFR